MTRMLLALLLPLAAVGSARAQQSTVDAAAAQTVAAMAQSNPAPGRIAVFDFVGPGDQFNALGRKLADDFSSALAKAGPNLKVTDRAHVEDAILKDALAPSALREFGSLAAVAQDLGVDAFVMGAIVEDGDTLRINVESLRVGDTETVANVNYSLPLDDAGKSLLAKQIVDDLDPTYPAAGHHGYGSPRCLYCPSPLYTREALKHSIQGVVELEVVVQLDGSAQEIRVLKPLPYGLTQAAIERVKTWRLTPATGPDGNPVGVRETIELNFSFH